VPSVLDPPWPALRSVAAALEPTGIVWRLGGSALQAALGLTDEVGDLDITVPADTLDVVRDALGHLAPRLVDGPPPEPWCSAWLLRARVGDIEVEVIGGFCVRTPSGAVPVPLDLGGHVDLEGVRVPLADPAVWWWVYGTYRPEAARRLEQVVDDRRRAEVLARLGPIRGD
jgi:hypothetical protein